MSLAGQEGPTIEGGALEIAGVSSHDALYILVRLNGGQCSGFTGFPRVFTLGSMWLGVRLGAQGAHH